MLQLEGVVFEAAPDGILVVDAQGIILRANATMEIITGYPPEALKGKPLDIFLAPDMRIQHVSYFKQFFIRPQRRAMGKVAHLKLMRNDGTPVPVDIAINEGILNGEVAAVAFIRDLSVFLQLESKIEYQATHDSLTGLYNRYAFQNQMRSALLRGQRRKCSLALLLLDLDDFKEVNDSYGHFAGDEVLMETSKRLRSELRDGDILARLGGDEFVILLPEIEAPENAIAVARKLLLNLSKPYKVEGFEMNPSASIGISIFPDDAQSTETLMRYADLAMYRAKTQGRNSYALYDVQMGLQIQEKMHVRDRLKIALLTEGALRLEYQPQVDVASGAMRGVEALLRWQDQELGNVPPDKFIPIAEVTGLIHPLGDWVLEQACQQLLAWRLEGIDLAVSVNISALQFRRDDLDRFLKSLLERYDIDPRHLELEITETVAMADPERTREVLLQLCALGVSVALDDFGTGYSALSYLRHLPVKRIKIDRTFMRAVPFDKEQTILVQAILSLAHTLDLHVVAEGVETQEQLQFLAQHRCSTYQGWLYAKALPAARAKQLWLENRQRAP
ncbi:MAG: GGDEF domain-containing protein [Burkholderiaceae bacterium]|nr:GGDEF domain-containing protein [Burkholderiaceae bacterium]